MNLIDTSPGLSSAARSATDGEGTAEPRSAPESMLTSTAAADSVACGASAYGAPGTSALAYLRLARGGSNAGAQPQSVASLSDPDEALAARFGPQFALIRAAMPTALQAQFIAQMTVAYDSAKGAEPAIRTGSTALSEHDLATLVAAGTSGTDEAAARAFVSRLSHDISQYGSAAVAQALQLAHERTAYAVAGEAPAARGDARVQRRDGDERERRRRHHECRTPPDERTGVTLPNDGHTLYTIEDVVRFGDETVATHRMLSPAPNIERTAL